MRIRIRTTVNQDHRKVWKGLNRELFLKLAPPFPPFKLLRFDGTETGGLVSLELDFIFFKQKWVSEIKEHGEDELGLYFVDHGVELPFFLKKWNHHHGILKKGKKTILVDDIHYETPWILVDWFIYPLMFLQFAYRIPIYKKSFA
jgi:ligand-binding SRPBCC domain-containing protein